MEKCFRPLSRGPFFNMRLKTAIIVPLDGFRPLSRGPFFNVAKLPELGKVTAGFRPLSRGPFFNEGTLEPFKAEHPVFVPFLGDLFSIKGNAEKLGIS